MPTREKNPQGTAFININQPVPELDEDGFTLERFRTRVNAMTNFDKDNGNVLGFTAWPWARLPNGSKEKFPISYWTISIVPDNDITEPGFCQRVMVCTTNGMPINHKGFDFTIKEIVGGKEVYVKYTRLIGIRGDAVVVTAIFGNDCKPAWYVDVHKLVNPEHAKIGYMLEPHKWDFPQKLITAGTSGQIPSREMVIAIILNDLDECINVPRKELLKKLVGVLADVYLQVCDLEASLPVSEIKMQATPAPAPKLETISIPAAEAPAPVADPEPVITASIPEVVDKPEAKPRHLAVAPDPIPSREDKHPRGGRDHTGKKGKPTTRQKHAVAGKNRGHDDIDLFAEAR